METPKIHMEEAIAAIRVERSRSLPFPDAQIKLTDGG